MFKSYRGRILPVLLTCLFISAIGVQPARARTAWIFDVNSTTDANDFVLNSVCSVGAVTGGPCTLRAAIAEANAIAASMDVTINIPAGTYDLTIAPSSPFDVTSGDLDFPQANPGYTIRLIGTGIQPAMIDANQLDRVFDISMGVNVQMENMVIRGGLLSWTGTADFYDGAGVLNLGNLTLSRVVIEDNEARCGQDECGFQISGGGILNLGQVSMMDSTIRNNTSVSASAFFNTGTSGYFFMKNTTISGNYANNAATIINYAYLHIRNSTISGNTAAPIFYSGIINYDDLVLESSTIANSGTNSSIFNSTSGNVSIHDSILVNRSQGGGSGNCQNFGTWTSGGYNIYNDATCPLTGTGDLGSTNPLLGALGSYGGLTQTMPLLVGSPAVDHRTGNCIKIPENPILPYDILTEDQRHIARTDDMCDTGAFEGSVRVFFLPLIFR